MLSTRMDTARHLAETHWPDDVTPERIKKVQGQLKINRRAENRKRSPHQKLAREILRETRELCRAENVGRKVERRPNGRGTWKRATELYVVDMRIRDGRIEYGLAFDRDGEPRYWEPRSACEGAFGSGSWRFAEPEAVHA